MANESEQHFPSYDDLQKWLSIIPGHLPTDDNWDGHGAKGYTEDDAYRVSYFLRELGWAVYHRKGAFPIHPIVRPGPDGTINLRWDHAYLWMLITLPRHNEGDKVICHAASIFGTGPFDSAVGEIKEEFNLADPIDIPESVITYLGFVLLASEKNLGIVKTRL